MPSQHVISKKPGITEVFQPACRLASYIFLSSSVLAGAIIITALLCLVLLMGYKLYILLKAAGL